MMPPVGLIMTQRPDFHSSPENSIRARTSAMEKLESPGASELVRLDRHPEIARSIRAGRTSFSRTSNSWASANSRSGSLSKTTALRSYGTTGGR